MVIVCSYKVYIQLIFGDKLFQCSSENKEKIDDMGIIEHGS